MVKKTAIGVVYIDAVEVGEVSLEYEDEAEEATEEVRMLKTVTGDVVLNEVIIGSISFFLEDLICSGEGGTRTVTVTGDVVVE